MPQTRSSQKIKVYWDFHGVMVNAGVLKSLAVKKLFDIYLPPERSTSELVKEDKIITTDQLKTAKKHAYDTEVFFDSMFPVHGAIVCAQKLLAHPRIECKIVTSVGEAGVKVIRKWLDSFGLQELEVVGTAGQPKTDFVRGADAYTDDALRKLKPLHGAVKHLFLFDREYNRHLKVKGICRRAMSWQHYYNSAMSFVK